MDTENRTTRNRLSLLADLQREPSAYGFYLAARLLECAHPDQPRIGTSRRLRDDPIRFGQEPSLAFALSTIARARLDRGPPRLLVNFLGLTGPNGALPYHLSEYVRDRDRNFGDRTLVHFLDTFHHRILSMFYRAWADAQPTVSLDRPSEDPFGRRLASLAGYGMRSLRDRDEVPDSAKLAHTGLLAEGVRHAEGLARMLANFFGIRAKVDSWQPHWMKLPTDALTRLGRGAENARLGRSSVLGRRVWDCQSRFRIVLGPLSLASYEAFLPVGHHLPRLRAWVLNYVGHELSCDAQLVLRRDEVPPTRLGKAGRLGWTTWIGRRRAPTDAADLVMNIL